jgi:hypothetical protein
MALSMMIVFTSLTDVRAESQDVSAQTVALSPVDPPEKIIEKQLKAFRDREAIDAYSFVSENLKHKYQDADHFLMMMRFTVQPLTSHLSYRILEASQLSDGLVQKVEMLRKDGTYVTVLYKLVQNEKGRWVIDGYTLLDNEAQPI